MAHRNSKLYTLHLAPCTFPLALRSPAIAITQSCRARSAPHARAGPVRMTSLLHLRPQASDLETACLATRDACPPDLCTSTTMVTSTSRFTRGSPARSPAPTGPQYTSLSTQHSVLSASLSHARAGLPSPRLRTLRSTAGRHALAL